MTMTFKQNFTNRNIKLTDHDVASSLFMANKAMATLHEGKQAGKSENRTDID